MISLSYDERGLSAMRAMGLGEWDINLVESEDPLAEVVDRCDRLDALADLRTRAIVTWEQHRRTNLDVLRLFGERISGPQLRLVPKKAAWPVCVPEARRTSTEQPRTSSSIGSEPRTSLTRAIDR